MTDHDLGDPKPNPTEPHDPKRIALRPITILLSIVIVLFLLVLGLPSIKTRFDLPFNLPWGTKGTQSTPEETTVSPTMTPTLGKSPVLELSPTPSAALPFLKTGSGLWKGGLILLSIQDGVDSHLFAYQPLADGEGTALPLTRLTVGPWDDITPVYNPNQDSLAFASNRGGQWDLHSLDFDRGKVTQITDTSEYEAAPSWSPDGLWMAYEGYFDNNLDIIIQLFDGSQDPIQLTRHPAADYQPAWSPKGREIAFVSTRGGRNQIWLANLDDSGDDRFIKLSSPSEATASHPGWSPDGRYLVWAAVTNDGLHNIYVWDSEDPGAAPKENGSGDWAVWSPDGQALLTVVNTPSQTYLTAYSKESHGVVVLPPIVLPGYVYGLVWEDLDISGSLVVKDQLKPTPPWDINIGFGTDGIEGRWDVIELEDVEAPYPRLHDRVDESFQALRLRIASILGWDFLANIENAYIPLSSALSPGLVEDWLYTGRAFSVNRLPINAGWMVIMREDFGQRTYWRIYLRTRYQDGSQGRPLYGLPWDFNARYSGQPSLYDQGGEQMAVVPEGYWVDFTQLTGIFGWERLPALINWQSAYPSARFNEFVMTDGLDWASAMLEIYPMEVLITLTPIPTPTQSQTPAPFWINTPTPSPSPMNTVPPTLTLTGTSIMSATPTGTQTRTPNFSATPTLTPTPTSTILSTDTVSPTATKTTSP
jgi:TolB protein